MSTINFPIMYINNPAQGKPIFNGKMYFGVPDLDPEIFTNQKQVYYIQENGDLVAASQPITLSAGGNPTYNGDAVTLSITGEYSMKVLNKLGVQEYYIARTDPSGDSGSVITYAEDEKELSASQVIVEFDGITAAVANIYIGKKSGDRGKLFSGDDYTVTGGSQITLTESYDAGTKIIASSSEFVERVESIKPLTLALAVASTTASEGDIVQITDRMDGQFTYLTGQTTNSYNIVEADSATLDLVLRDEDITYLSKFGADGGGAVDNQTVFQIGLDLRKETFLANAENAYLLESGVVVDDVTFKGGNNQLCKINFSPDAGTAISLTGSEFSAGLENMFINYSGTGPSARGVHLGNNTNISLKNLKIDNFPGKSMTVGDTAAFEAAFFATVENVYIRLDTGTTGDTAIFIDGGSVPSSNANVFKNIFTNGQFTKAHLHIKGNNNKFIGGDCQWENSASSEAIILIEGSGNTIDDVYLESAVDFLTPDTIIKFTNTAFGNKLRVWMVGEDNFNWESAIDDQGSGNEVIIMNRGVNFPANFDKKTYSNLCRNVSLDKWRDANNPRGYVNGTVRTTKDTVNTFQGNASIKMLEAGTNSAINFYLTDSFADPITKIPVEDLLNKNLAVGVWCKSSVASSGSIGLRTNGTGSTSATSKSVHSGSGAWEFLSTTLLINSDATNVWFDLRSQIENLPITGTVNFAHPVVMYGDTAITFAEPSTNSDGDIMNSDLGFYNVPASTNPDDFAMIELNGSFLWVDSAGDLRISTTRPTTNTDTEGVIVGTQS